MSTSKDFLNFVLEQLSELDEITYRMMMGEYIIYYRGTRRLPMEHGEAVIGTREDCQWDAVRLQLRHKKIVDGVQRGCNGDAERQSL